MRNILLSLLLLAAQGSFCQTLVTAPARTAPTSAAPPAAMESAATTDPSPISLGLDSPAPPLLDATISANTGLEPQTAVAPAALAAAEPATLGPLHASPARAIPQEPAQANEGPVFDPTSVRFPFSQLPPGFASPAPEPGQTTPSRAAVLRALSQPLPWQDEAVDRLAFEPVAGYGVFLVEDAVFEALHPGASGLHVSAAKDPEKRAREVRGVLDRLLRDVPAVRELGQARLEELLRRVFTPLHILVPRSLFSRLPETWAALLGHEWFHGMHEADAALRAVLEPAFRLINDNSELSFSLYALFRHTPYWGALDSSEFWGQWLKGLDATADFDDRLMWTDLKHEVERIIERRKPGHDILARALRIMRDLDRQIREEVLRDWAPRAGKARAAAPPAA